VAVGWLRGYARSTRQTTIVAITELWGSRPVVKMKGCGMAESSSSSSGTMEPEPVGVHCLFCNEFPSSAIMGQTVQSCSPVLHQLTVSSIHYMACLFYSFRLQFQTSVSLASCCPPSFSVAMVNCGYGPKSMEQPRC